MKGFLILFAIIGAIALIVMIAAIISSNMRKEIKDETDVRIW